MVVDSSPSKTLSSYIWPRASGVVVWCATITKRMRETEGHGLAGSFLRIDYMVTC